jgi:hypothetical protein
LYVPPTNGTIIRISREDTVIDDNHIVNIHDMTNVNVSFLNTVLSMHIVNSHSIIKTGNDKLFTNNIAPINRNLVPSNFLFVPKQYEFVFVTSD